MEELFVYQTVDGKAVIEDVSKYPKVGSEYNGGSIVFRGARADAKAFAKEINKKFKSETEQPQKEYISERDERRAAANTRFHEGQRRKQHPKFGW